MKYRRLGKTEMQVSEISLGTWQLGGKWGAAYDHQSADKILRTAIDEGVNFIDTADVYNDGLSETSIGKVLKSIDQEVCVATKCGRQIQPHEDPYYQPKALQQYLEDSLRRLQVDTLDLIQLHCPPTATYQRDDIFELFDRLKTEGKVRHLGVSVEKVEEALTALTYDNVTTVQIIFNLFRHKPAEMFFAEARKRDVGIIARVPLASGLLTGKFTASSQFGEGDHRHFNRNGEQFDKGETFSGVPFETGLSAVEKIKSLFPDTKLSYLALQWILAFEDISCVIPGASNLAQLEDNLAAVDSPALSTEELSSLRQLYDEEIREHVHHLW